MSERLGGRKREREQRVCLKIGSQSNKTDVEIKTQKNAKIETHIYVVHTIWDTYTKKLLVISFILSN